MSIITINIIIVAVACVALFGRFLRVTREKPRNLIIDDLKKLLGED